MRSGVRKVLPVDDDRSLIEAISIGLRMQWSNVTLLDANDGLNAVRLFAGESPDLTLLDVNLPRLNGWDALKQMRQISDARVIMLTARGEEMDKIHGLGLGADDYLPGARELTPNPSPAKLTRVGIA